MRTCPASHCNSELRRPPAQEETSALVQWYPFNAATIL
jgi:hypothetical protein